MAVVIRKAIQQHHAQRRPQGKEILPVLLLLESFANEAGIVPGRRLRRRYIRQSPRSPEVVHLFSSFYFIYGFVLRARNVNHHSLSTDLEIPGIASGPAAVDD